MKPLFASNSDRWSDTERREWHMNSSSPRVSPWSKPKRMISNASGSSYASGSSLVPSRASSYGPAPHAGELSQRSRGKVPSGLRVSIGGGLLARRCLGFDVHVGVGGRRVRPDLELAWGPGGLVFGRGGGGLSLVGVHVGVDERLV